MPLGNELVVHTRSAAGTEAVGRALATHLRPGDVLALVGDLGSGKTVFVKGLARGLGVDPRQAVTSPTFVLITEYPGRLTLYHVDAYRLATARDFAALGAEEILFGDGVCAIEWADRVEAALPAERLLVELAVEGETARRIALTATGVGWEARRRQIQTALDAALAAS